MTAYWFPPPDRFTPLSARSQQLTLSHCARDTQSSGFSINYIYARIPGFEVNDRNGACLEEHAILFINAFGNVAIYLQVINSPLRSALEILCQCVLFYCYFHQYRYLRVIA